VVEGEFIPRVQADVDVVPISMEVGVAEQMKVELGDEIEWDVQGLLMMTKITSLREVEWRRMEPNFFCSFPGRSIGTRTEVLCGGDAGRRSGALRASAASRSHRFAERIGNRPAARHGNAGRDF